MSRASGAQRRAPLSLPKVRGARGGTPLGALHPFTWAGVLALALCGCGPKVVDGSLSEILDLHYQAIEAQGSGGQQTLRYTTPQGSGENIVFEVSANLSGLKDYAPGTVVDLAEVVNGAQRGQVARNVFSEARQDFPQIARGHLTFNDWLYPPDTSHVPGRKVQGDFSITFIECTDFACGRTVYGIFEATVP